MKQFKNKNKQSVDSTCGFCVTQCKNDWCSFTSKIDKCLESDGEIKCPVVELLRPKATSKTIAILESFEDLLNSMGTSNADDNKKAS